MDAAVRTILDRYIAAAQGHGRGTEAGDSVLANRCYKRIIQALHKLDSSSDRGRAVLDDLLGHDSLDVRCWAATHLLKTYPDEAIAVLEALVESPGIVGFNATIILQEWRNGTLRIP